MHDDLLNITQLAGRLGVRERVIQRYVDARTIPIPQAGEVPPVSLARGRDMAGNTS